jgi:hypothetical protein
MTLCYPLKRNSFLVVFGLGNVPVARESDVSLFEWLSVNKDLAPQDFNNFAGQAYDAFCKSLRVIGWILNDNNVPLFSILFWQGFSRGGHWVNN